MKKIKINKKIIFGLALLGIYLAFFGIGAIFGGLSGGNKISGLALMGSGRVNILFMGIDARGQETNARSDTMILASIDKGSNKAVLIWIPRDTRIETGKGRYDKINSVNAIKGLEAACQAVGKLLNTKVDYYVLANFQGFTKIVGGKGGRFLPCLISRPKWVSQLSKCNNNRPYCIHADEYTASSIVFRKFDLPLGS